MTRWLPRRPARTPSSTRALCGRIGSVPRDEFSERAAAVPCHGEPWRGREYREQPSGRGLGPAFGRLGPALGRCFWRFFLQAALRGTPAWLRFAAAQAEYISYLCQISGTASNANSQSSRSPLEGIRKSPRFSSRRSSTASTGLTPLLGALSSTPSSDPHLVASAWTAAAGAGDTRRAHPLRRGCSDGPSPASPPHGGEIQTLEIQTQRPPLRRQRFVCPSCAPSWRARRRALTT